MAIRCQPFGSVTWFKAVDGRFRSRLGLHLSLWRLGRTLALNLLIRRPVEHSLGASIHSTGLSARADFRVRAYLRVRVSVKVRVRVDMWSSSVVHNHRRCLK